MKDYRSISNFRKKITYFYSDCNALSNNRKHNQYGYFSHLDKLIKIYSDNLKIPTQKLL